MIEEDKHLVNFCLSNGLLIKPSLNIEKHTDEVTTLALIQDLLKHDYLLSDDLDKLAMAHNITFSKDSTKAINSRIGKYNYKIESKTVKINGKIVRGRYLKEL